MPLEMELPNKDRIQLSIVVSQFSKSTDKGSS